MDTRKLRYFVAVAEELNFTRAARRLHIAQPPLSQHIRQLEDELGVVLLHRTQRRVELSEAGRALLERARQILRATEGAVLEAQQAARGEVGRVAVGFFEHMSYTWLPPILRAYRERYPRVNVQLRWFPVIQQADALRRGEVDIAFMRPVPDVEGTARETLVREPFVLAIPDRHPLARHASLALRQCAKEPFIVYTPHLAPDFHRMILGMCAKAGFIPEVALDVGQVYTALGLVSSGAGLAFVPSSVQRVRFDRVAYRPIRGRTPPIEVSLGRREGAQPSAQMQAFLEVARGVVRAG